MKEISLCGRSCDKCIYKGLCGGCSMCEASVCKKGCKGCATICPMRGATFEYISSLIDISAGKNSELDISFHIPVLPDRLSLVLPHTIVPIAAIHGESLMCSNGENVSRNYRINGFRKALNLDSKTEGIAEFYIKDRSLEGFWDNRKEVYKQIKEQGFKAVIAPNFSVYEDTPRIEHIYNIQRSKAVYNEMLTNDIQAIPDISWYSHKDIDAWIDDINKGIKVISFSFQTVDVRSKASNIWMHYLLGFRYLCENINPGTKIIIAGASSYRRIKDIIKAAGQHSVHILNQSAYVQSIRGMYSEGRVRDLSTPKMELLIKNITYFNELYSKLNKGVL